MMIQGNSFFYKKEFENAAKSYERLLSLYPGDADGESNLAVALRDTGKYFGERKQDLVKAEKYLRRSLAIRPKDVETNRLLGVTNGIKGNHKEAIKYFKKVADLQPNNALSYVNLYNAYGAYGDDEKARLNYEKALKLNPEAFTK
jgi:tetratricopeptide (TPR) repeat protein